MENRKYGALRDSFDVRDHVMRAGAFTAGPSLPRRSNNRAFTGPTKDQGREGSCTGHAGTAAWELEWRKFRQETPVFSAAFLYAVERQIEGTFPQDGGAQPRSIGQALTKYGVCLEWQEPYSDAQVAVAPTTAQILEALRFRTGAYHRLINLDDARACLADLPNFPGHPFLYSFNVPSVFEGHDVANNGIVPVPSPSDYFVGAHEVLAVDYDDDVHLPGARWAGAILFQNSWGAGWGCDPGNGRRGYFWMSYETVFNPRIVGDLWIIHLGGPWK